MRTTRLSQPLYLALASVLICLCAGGPVWGQSFDWKTTVAASQGLSKEKLDALARVMAAKKTKVFLVIRNDKIVYEWYAEGHDAAKTQGTASLAKAIVGGLSLAVAITDGKMTLDDKAAKYVAQWKDDPRQSKITLRRLHAQSQETGCRPGDSRSSLQRLVPPWQSWPQSEIRSGDLYLHRR